MDGRDEGAARQMLIKSPPQQRIVMPTFDTMVAHVGRASANRFVDTERLDGTSKGREGEETAVALLSPFSVQLSMSMRENACRCDNAVHFDGATGCRL